MSLFLLLSAGVLKDISAGEHLKYTSSFRAASSFSGDMSTSDIDPDTLTLNSTSNTVEVFSCNNLDYFKATSTSENTAMYNAWVNAIGSGGVPEYLQDFESFSNDQNLDGVNIGPNGLTLTNIDIEGGTLRAKSSPGGSPAIGNRGAAVSANANDSGDDVRIDFDCDATYVGFYFIDLTNPNHSSEVEVTFDNGSTCIIPIDHQPQNCQCEEFLGIVAKNGRTITRVDILPIAGSTYGIDNVMFGCEIPACDLTNANRSSVSCNNNGSGSNPDDDYITFNLNPTGNNLSSTYSVFVNNGGTVSRANGNPATNIPYGSTTSFRLHNGSANGVNYTITVRDNADNSCTVTTTVQRNSCSSDCTLTTSKKANEACNNNNTPSVGTDDYITFSLNPDGNNLGSSYTVTANNGATVSLAGGGSATNVSYGNPTTFRLQNGSANGTNYTITIRDNADNSCTITTTVHQDPCSDSCNLMAANLSSESCNDNGTVPNSNDDYITFELNPTGLNLGFSYNVFANNGGTVTLLNGSPATNVPFGTTTAFRMQNGSANGSEYTVTVQDAEDSDCAITIPLQQNPCSYLCDLSVQTLPPVYNDNNTPNNLSDDTFTFQIIVQGSGPSGWEGGGLTGAFGVPTLFGPYPVDQEGALFEVTYAGTTTNCSVWVGVNMDSCIYTGSCTCCTPD